jgi:hypothetical protein
MIISPQSIKEGGREVPRAARKSGMEVDFDAIKAAYIGWLATPLSDREPKHQDELAQQLGVTADYLRTLRRNPSFMADLAPALQNALRDLLPTLIGKYLDNAKDAPATQVRQFFEEVGLLSKADADNTPKVIIGLTPEEL